MNAKEYIIALCFLICFSTEITGKLCSIESRIDTLITQSSEQESIVCSLLEDVVIIESNVDVLDTSTGEHLQKACSIESITDVINVDLEFINSRIETVLECQISAESVIDTAGPVLQDEIFSKVCEIDLQVVASLSLVDIIDSQLDIINVISSKTDFALSYSSTLESKWCSLDTTINLYDESILSVIDVLESVTLAIETIESKLDETILTIGSIESIIDTSTLLASTAISHIDFIESKIDKLTDGISIVDSLVDIIECEITEPCKVSFVTEAQPVNAARACDWSFGDKIIAVGLNSGGGQDTLNTYLFDGSTLTFVDSAQPGSDNNIVSVRWHPRLQLLAIGKDAGGDQLYTYTVDGNGNLTQVDSTTTSGGNALAWHPTGNYLVAAGIINGIEIVLYPVDSIGNIDDPGRLTVDLAGLNVQQGALDWDITGSYLAVGTNNVVGKDNLRIYEFNTDPLSLVQNAGVEITGLHVEAISWHPTTTDILAITTNGDIGDCNVCIYRHDASAGTLTLLSFLNILTIGIPEVQWNSNGNCLAVGKPAELSLYNFNTTTYALTEALTIPSSANIDGIRWDHAGNHIALATNHPGLFIYETSLIARVINLEANMNEMHALNQTIINKIEVACNNIESASSVIDTIEFTFDQSEIFTVIQAIQDKACIADSLIDGLIDNIQGAQDYSGVFTLIEASNEKVDNSISLVDEITLSTTVLDELQGCLGTAIRQSDITATGFTISTAGKYYLAENLVHSPVATGTYCITISTNNVVLDLRGKTISQGNAIGSTGGIIATITLDNITIKNGNVEDFTLYGIRTDQINNLTLEDLYVQGASTNLYMVAGNAVRIKNSIFKDAASNGAFIFGNDSTPIRMLLIDNCVFEGAAGTGNTTGGGLMIRGTQSEVSIKNSSFINNNRHGILFSESARNLLKFGFVIENCLFANNGITGIDMVTGRENTRFQDVVFKNNTLIDNGTYGMRMAYQDVGRWVVIHNNFSRNGSYGIYCKQTNVLDNEGNNNLNNIFMFNTFIENGTANYEEQSNQGPNTLLGNFAYHSSGDGSNYVLGSGTGIPKAIVSQSGIFPATTPTHWYNVSATT